MTQTIAELIGNSQESRIARLTWTGLFLMSIFGLLGAMLTAILSPWFVSHLLQVSESLRGEATWAFIMLSLSIPAVVLSSGFAGILAAIQRFDLINYLRIPMGMMIFLIPLAILPHTKSIAFVCAGLMIIRVIFMFLYAGACLYTLPALWHPVIERSEIKRLLSFGGWMTTTNLIGPLMVYMDRFVIGALLSISAVAYYVTPYEMVTRLWAIPGSIVLTLFPAFASSKHSDIQHATELYSMGARAILVLLAPIVLIFVVFAKEGLNIWLGGVFAQKSGTVLQWIIIGVYINSYAQVPFAFIQGLGRADITAKLHLLELPVYLALMFWLLHLWGIIGVAVAFLIRTSLDAFLLTLMAQKLKKDITSASMQILPMVVLPFTLFAIGMSLNVMSSKIVFTGFGLIALIGVSYTIVLTSEERTVIQKSLYRFFRREEANEIRKCKAK